MKFIDEKSRDRLKVGLLLLLAAGLTALAVLRFDQVFGALNTLGNTLVPVLGGLVIAYILNVFVHFFEDIAFKPFEKSKSKVWKKLKRPVSVTLAYLVVLLVIVFIVCFIIPSLVDSMSVLTLTVQRNVPIYANKAMVWADGMAQKYDLTFVQNYLDDVDWKSLFNMLGDATKFTTEVLTKVFSVTANLASGMFSVIMAFIFSVYMLSGKERLIRGVKDALKAFLPKRAAVVTARVARLSNQVFFSFIRGQLTECVILGVLCYIGMSILRLDYALLISSVVALGALIPILGAYIGAGVGAFILLLVHPIDALIFVVFLVILQQLEGNLIYPRVVGSSIGLPPIWTIFAVTFWGGVMGIVGIWIGTPLTAVFYRLFRERVYSRLAKKRQPEPEAGEAK